MKSILNSKHLKLLELYLHRLQIRQTNPNLPLSLLLPQNPLPLLLPRLSFPLLPKLLRSLSTIERLYWQLQFQSISISSLDILEQEAWDSEVSCLYRFLWEDLEEEGLLEKLEKRQRELEGWEGRLPVWKETRGRERSEVGRRMEMMGEACRVAKT